jgi:hypothetical protein
MPDTVRESITVLINGLIQTFWALFFILYGLWLFADTLAGRSHIAKNIVLSGFIILVTVIRYLALYVLQRIQTRSVPFLSGNEQGVSKQRESALSKEPWFPQDKMRFLLCLCAAAVLLYFASEITSRWAAGILSLPTLIVLHFSQHRPAFHPFRWWTLLALPISGLWLGLANSPISARASVLSMAFGLSVLLSGAKSLIRYRGQQ